MPRKKITPRKRTTVWRKKGIPQAAPKVDGGTLPSFAPDTQGKDHLEREKILGQVEILYLKGITSATALGAMLGISHGTARKYIERVQYRWAFTGNFKRMSQLRGEARARLDMITAELWQIFTNTDSESTKLSALSELLGIHDRRLILDGLTDTMLAYIREREEEGESSIEVDMAEHADMIKLGKQLIGYLETEYKVIKEDEDDE